MGARPRPVPAEPEERPIGAPQEAVSQLHTPESKPAWFWLPDVVLAPGCDVVRPDRGASPRGTRSRPNANLRIPARSGCGGRGVPRLLGVRRANGGNPAIDGPEPKWPSARSAGGHRGPVGRSADDCCAVTTRRRRLVHRCRFAPVRTGKPATLVPGQGLEVGGPTCRDSLLRSEARPNFRPVEARPIGHG